MNSVASPTQRPAGAGLAVTTRLAWRRNRVFWITWVLLLASLMPATASQYDSLVPTGSDPESFLGALAANPAMRALLGPPFDLTTPGGFTAWRVGNFTAWLAGLASALAVIRVTRAEEESGRGELIRAAAVGRHSTLGAALLTTGGATAGLGILCAATMWGLSNPVSGSVALGAAVTATAWMFSAVAAVAAQVFESARAARAWAVGGVLGGGFILRALVDGIDTPTLSWLRWVNPVEWPALARPFAGERWWVLALPVSLTALLAAVAVALESRRDHASGLRPTRLGPQHGSPHLRSVGSLVRRLNRSSTRGWFVGIVVGAILIGMIGRQLATSIAASPRLLEILQRIGGAGDPQAGFQSAMLSVLAGVICLFALQILLQVRAEEAAGRMELMLSTSTSRPTYLTAHVRSAVVTSTLLLAASSPLLALPLAIDSGQTTPLIRSLQAATALLPGLWVVVGIGTFVIGQAPRLTPLLWAVVGWTMFCGWLGALLGLPGWLVRLQPFGHLSSPLTGPVSWPPTVLTTALAVTLIALGFHGFSRRSIPSP